MKRLRVLVLIDPTFMPPDSTKGYTAQEINEWKTEYDIVSTLRAAGHEVRPFGVEDELKAVRDEIDGFKPNVVFTLLEDFHGKVIYDGFKPTGADDSGVVPDCRPKVGDLVNRPSMQLGIGFDL